MPNDKLLPSDVDAERAVLGSILLNRDAISAVAAWLQPDDFYTEQHGWIYAAMQDCYRRRTPPDAKLVSGVLRQREQLEATGGLPYLIALVDHVPTSYHIEFYAKAVQQAALLRGLIQAGGRIARIGFDGGDADQALADAHAALHEVASRAGGGTDLVPLGAVISEVYDYLANDAPAPTITTGLCDVDDLLGGGLWRGNLVVVAGRPRHGKSAFAGTVAMAAAKAGHTTAVYSLEMQRRELAMRYIAAESNVDGGLLRQRALQDDDLTRAIATMGRMDWPLYLDDVRRTVADIRARCLRLADQRGGLGLVVVDYLQLVRPATSRDPRRDQIADIARSLLDLAVELQCPVLVPTQMNRDIESRDDKTPLLSDLGDSGEIERAAHVISFLIRPELWPHDDEDASHHNKALLYIEKDRNGPGGVVPLRWDGSRTTFSNLTYRDVAGY